MSSLIVEVCAVEETAAIEGADRIERVRVKNWWCIAGKGHYKIGDKAVYVPPDSVLPEELAERWGIAKYCASLPKDMSGNREPGLRVRAAKFKGVSSFGTIQDPDDPSWPVGHDVKDHYGIKKFEPPLKSNDGDAATPISTFHNYTGIENLGNFPGVLHDGEEVVCTEKIHGTNCRVGYVLNGQSEDNAEKWEFVAGSHSIRRKEFSDKGARSRYWFPFHVEPTECPLRMMLVRIMNKEKATHSVIVFGEIFGPGVQDMHYGQKGLSFRAFDISVDGTYLDEDIAKAYLKEAGIDVVPLLYRGPFSMEKVHELVDGPTTVCPVSEISQPFKGREGIVVKPIKERFDGILGGRTILKFISVEYHERKNKDKTEDH